MIELSFTFVMICWSLVVNFDIYDDHEGTLWFLMTDDFMFVSGDMEFKQNKFLPPEKQIVTASPDINIVCSFFISTATDVLFIFLRLYQYWRPPKNITIALLHDVTRRTSLVQIWKLQSVFIITIF